MLWLQSPPWGRWLVAGLVVVFAMWMELRPETTVDHPFAIRLIVAGEPITPANTEKRPVIRGTVEPIPAHPVARRDIPPGSPVLVHDVGGVDDVLPQGLWMVSLEVPASARTGDPVRVVLVDSGMVVEGVVASVGDEDSFSSGRGSVAIPGDHAAVVAAAAVNGRVVVLVSTR